MAKLFMNLSDKFPCKQSFLNNLILQEFIANLLILSLKKSSEISGISNNLTILEDFSGLV